MYAHFISHREHVYAVTLTVMNAMPVQGCAGDIKFPIKIGPLQRAEDKLSVNFKKIRRSRDAQAAHSRLLPVLSHIDQFEPALAGQYACIVLLIHLSTTISSCRYSDEDSVNHRMAIGTKATTLLANTCRDPSHSVFSNM